MKTPPTPTTEVIQAYLAKWENYENYRLQEQALSLLFHQYCSDNTKLENVLLKVTALNQFYSTNILNTFLVAKHILAMNIDARLRSGDLTLVNQLALVSMKEGKKINFYSFATKYCNHHLPEAFPIYDSFVERMLLHYRSVDKFSAFKKSDLKDYNQFVQVITSFQKHYNLNHFSLRQLDVFLWDAGKECFPKNYAKKKSGQSVTQATNGVADS